MSSNAIIEVAKFALSTAVANTNTNPKETRMKTKGLKEGANYTVDVVDKTGRAIHSSKTILSAFREARDTYRSRKAAREEDKVQQAADEEAHRVRLERRARRERETSTERHERHRDERRQRRLIEGPPTSQSRSRRGSSGSEQSEFNKGEGEDYETALAFGSSRPSKSRTHSGRSSRSMVSDTSYQHSNFSTSTLATLRHGNMSTMSLLPAAIQDDKLTPLFLHLASLMDIHATITSFIDALRRDPETLGMVALSLAEISSVVTKLAPGALLGMKLAWPGVFAVLASPQFAILAGGTIIMVGGFMVMKRLLTSSEDKKEEEAVVETREVDLGGRVTGEQLEIQPRMAQLQIQAAPPAPMVQPSKPVTPPVPHLAFDLTPPPASAAAPVRSKSSRPSKSRSASDRTERESSRGGESSRSGGLKHRSQSYKETESEREERKKDERKKEERRVKESSRRR